MKASHCGAVLLTVVGLSGCATNWQHLSITDVDLANRQFKLDDAYCLSAAYGAVPMPTMPVTAANTSSNVSGQMSVYDSSTGQTSFGSYSGTVTTSPANSFASGFSNGIALGAAIQAQKAQDQIHDECMKLKGWREVAPGVPHAAPIPAATNAAPIISQKSKDVSTVNGSLSKSPEAIYNDAKGAWLAEVNEFMLIYPQYKESPLLWNRLDAAVRKLAKERPLATGPQILLAAHDSLNLKGEGSPEPARGEQGWFIASAYRQAVAGSVVDQNALGMGFMHGKKPFPRNLLRARFWFQKSAMAGDPLGEMGYGTLIFEGDEGHAPDHPRGYWWVKKAAAAGESDATGMLTVMKTKMNATELRAAQAMQ